MNELPQSIQSLINSSSAFAMVCIALVIIYRRLTKAENEKTDLLKDKGDVKKNIEDIEKSLDGLDTKANTTIDKLNEILYKK